MSDGASRISKAIEGIDDISSPSGKKWEHVYQIVAEIFELSEDKTYLTYINKASNAQVRISKQMPTERPVHVAFGVCGSVGDWTSTSYPTQATRAMLSRPSLNCIVFMWETGSARGRRWEARLVYHRPGAPEALVAEELWPRAELIEIAGANPAAVRETITDLDFTETVIHLLRQNKNVVLEGVPGTGKSFAVNEVARRWQSLTGRELASTDIIVLHPSSSYEDLVEGLRPQSVTGEPSQDFTEYGAGQPADSKFVAQLGRFTAAAAKAASDPESDFLLVLDELNRANVPRSLGELLLVMEAGKRARFLGNEWLAPLDGVVRLTYTGTKFWVPDNLYILATMNTTDRSVAPLDAALRRRFVFKRIEPFTEGQIQDRLAGLEVEAQNLFDLVVETWAVINDEVLRPVVGPDAVLGHSYLFDLHSTLLRSEPDSAGSAIESFLRYTYLPQLIDSVAMYGRESEIFEPDSGRLALISSSALMTLDALLELFGIRIVLEGQGLSRRLSVVARELSAVFPDSAHERDSDSDS